MKIKRIKRCLMILALICLYFIPKQVYAANLTMSATSTKVKPGDSVTLSINATNFSNGFGSMTFIVKYDSSKFTYTSGKSSKGTAIAKPGSGLITVTIESSNGTDAITNGKIYEIILKANSNATSGMSNLNITSNDCYDINGSTTIPITGSSLNITHYTPSTINTLKSLSITGCNLNPTFNPSTQNYTCSDTDSSSVTIKASATDSNAKIKGTGNKNLNYGSNKLTISVTSESGVRKNYIITINRNDNRNTNNTLSTLSIEGYQINFDPNQTTYNLEVEYDVKSININATTTDSSSTITGFGNHNLEIGNNLIEIKVTAENGMTKVYTINVNRIGPDNVPSTTLTKLSYNGFNIDLNNDQRIYNIGVDNTVNNLNLLYQTNSTTSKYQIEGNENFKEGINRVLITVTDDGVENSVYTLLVYKFININNIVPSLKNIENFDTDKIYNSMNTEVHKIPTDIITKLKESNNSLEYNVINENNGILYSLSFNKDIDYPENLELYLYKNTDNSFSYSSSIPKDVLINLYLDSKETINENMYLYSFDIENNKYTLIDDNIRVNDNYVQFKSTGSSMYLITKNLIKTSIVEEKTPFKEWLTRFQYLVIGIIIGLISYYLIKNYLNKKNKPNNIKIGPERL